MYTYNIVNALLIVYTTYIRSKRVNMEHYRACSGSKAPL